MENKNLFNYFSDAVTTNYANFNGRARRKEYWGFFLVYMIIYVILGLITRMMPSIGAILSMVFVFAMLVPALAVAVRRVHDTGKSGWFILIPIYNLVLYLTDGNKGPNEYGPDPKNPELNTEIENIGTE